MGEIINKKILITGAKGFIGSNLAANLKRTNGLTVFELDVDSTTDKLAEFISSSDFVFHLAGVNRPKNTSEFMTGNRDFTAVLIDTLKKTNNNCPVLFTSSVQAELDNPYGESKRAGENLLREYSKESGAQVLIYRLPNVFGKWCRPNYNSVVATFCHNIANELPININDPSAQLNLVYIDDIIEEFCAALNGKANIKDNFGYIKETHSTTVGELAEIILGFAKSRLSLISPDMSSPLTLKLYSTYLSYLPEDKFGYPLKKHEDARGSFTEIIKSLPFGQVSVNVIKPGITKGGHWHNTKTEKFIVVSGMASIKFRKITGGNVIEYIVSGNKPEVIDIPPGYTHNIKNIGEGEVIAFIWANEFFDPNRPDTLPESVE